MKPRPGGDNLAAGTPAKRFFLLLLMTLTFWIMGVPVTGAGSGLYAGSSQPTPSPELRHRLWRLPQLVLALPFFYWQPLGLKYVCCLSLSQSSVKSGMMFWWQQQWLQLLFRRRSLVSVNLRWAWLPAQMSRPNITQTRNLPPLLNCRNDLLCLRLSTIPWLLDVDAAACEACRCCRCSAWRSFAIWQKTCRGEVHFIHKSRGASARTPREPVTSAHQPAVLFQLQYCRNNTGILAPAVKSKWALKKKAMVLRQYWNNAALLIEFNKESVIPTRPWTVDWRIV